MLTKNVFCAWVCKDYAQPKCTRREVLANGYGSKIHLKIMKKILIYIGAIFFVSCSPIKELSVTSCMLDGHDRHSIAEFEYLTRHPSKWDRIKRLYISKEDSIRKISDFLQKNLILKLPNNWNQKILTYQERDILLQNHDSEGESIIDGKYEPSEVIDVTNRIVFHKKQSQKNDTLYVGDYRPNMQNLMKIVQYKHSYYVVPVDFCKNLNNLIPIY